MVRFAGFPERDIAEPNRRLSAIFVRVWDTRPGHSAKLDACEQDRLAALNLYDALDTPSEEAFGRITRLVRSIFAVSMSTAGVPERFKLGVVSEELHRMCRIAGKRGTQIEVVFE